MKCFYHSDADGVCAAYWVVQGTYSPIKSCQYRPITYGDPFPFEDIEPDEEIWIVDYSIEPEEMDRLLDITLNVTWIDHHKTAIEKYKDYPKPIRGVRLNGIAGCMLTYAYLNHMTHHGTSAVVKPFEPWMAEAAPTFTRLIADWDV